MKDNKCMHFLNVDKVVFIGTGGTGGYLIPKVLRMLAGLPAVVANTKMIFIDGDKVAEKNVLRQNFIYSDIGKNKAEVLASRYAMLYGYNTRVIPKFMDYELLDQVAGGGSGETCTLIVDAVDKKAPRVAIDDYVKNQNLCYWLSLGNGFNDGQAVIYSSNYDGSRTIVDLFPDDFSEKALEKEREEENAANCAQNAQVNPQSLAINEMSATVGMNIIRGIFYDKVLDYDVVFFDYHNGTRIVKVGEPIFQVNKNVEIDFSLLAA